MLFVLIGCLLGIFGGYVVYYGWVLFVNLNWFIEGFIIMNIVKYVSFLINFIFVYNFIVKWDLELLEIY